MTDTIINLETVNPIEFFGVNNGKLDILKKKFPLLKILSRGTQLKLSGAPEQVDSAKEKIELIVQYLQRNGHMSENYFEQILGGDDAETVDNFRERNPHEILVFGPKWQISTCPYRQPEKNGGGSGQKRYRFRDRALLVPVKHIRPLRWQSGH